MNQNPTIDILLATYNGERYLSEQIQSLLDQTYTNWRLLIRDDGSSDDTVSIIRRFQIHYPEKIVFIDDGLANLGACRNFARLLERTDAECVMFCDQDDVWLPTKITLTREKMLELTAKYGNGVPLLVYTDMQVVDENLAVISGSFWKNQAFNPEIGKSLGRFLVSNVATGCTVMINKRLRDLAVPMPAEAMMHDWWVGLISVALGKNGYVCEPTMLYRQHVSNAVGAKWDASLKSIIRKVLDFDNLKRINRAHLLKTQEQAKAFAAKYRDLLPTEELTKVKAYAELDSKNYFAKRIIIVQYGFWWAGFLRSLTMFIIS